jgi:hypothetical protein
VIRCCLRAIAPYLFLFNIIKGITSYLLFSFFQELRCFILWMKVKKQEKELIVLYACFTIIFSTSHMERQQSSYIWIIALVKTRIAFIVAIFNQISNQNVRLIIAISGKAVYKYRYQISECTFLLLPNKSIYFLNLRICYFPSAICLQLYVRIPP